MVTVPLLRSRAALAPSLTSPLSEPMSASVSVQVPLASVTSAAAYEVLDPFSNPSNIDSADGTAPIGSPVIGLHAARSAGISEQSPGRRWRRSRYMTFPLRRRMWRGYSRSGHFEDSKSN